MQKLPTDKRTIKQYESKLRDDRLVYNELYNLYYHAIDNKIVEFEESLQLISDQVQKYPESISKQMYLLSYLASQCLSSFGKKIYNQSLLKKLLSFILELVLSGEKNSSDCSVCKRVICVLTPYLQFIADSKKVSYFSDVLSRLIKVLVFLNNINRNEFKNFFNNNYVGIKNLSELFPGSWIPYLLKKDSNYNKSNKNSSKYGYYKDSFEDSILDSLYEPPLNGFDVKKYKLKNSYSTYEKMDVFRWKLREEMKDFIS